MKSILKKIRILFILFGIIFICMGVTMAFASGDPSIKISNISYNDSFIRELDYDFTSGELVLFNPGYDGERLTLFLPDPSVTHPDDKTFYMRAWNELKRASINNDAGHLKFSIPKIKDCLSGSLYGTFVSNWKDMMKYRLIVLHGMLS